MSVESRLPSRSDRTGLYLYVGIGAVAVAAVVWRTVERLVAVAPGHDIPVLVALEQNAALPIGPGGSPFDATVERAVVTVADPAPATLFALWAHPLVTGVAWIAGIVIAALFCVGVARGAAFRTSTTMLVYAGVGVLAVGWFAGSLLGQMSANGAVSAVSDYAVTAAQYPTDWSAVFGMLALVAVGVALQLGQRLRRDTEGLV